MADEQFQYPLPRVIGTLIPIPPEAGKLVAMTIFKDRLIIAAEFGIFEYVDGQLVPIPVASNAVKFPVKLG
ncbi:hypothetical protein P3T24_004342 [Paraburkholderia sp. GAS33]|uniref:hypothetical protein n=1 Tax=Paraburkholderia sp. GAS33 TaxID=3035130 RepID=UPI003D2372DF